MVSVFLKTFKKIQTSFFFKCLRNGQETDVVPAGCSQITACFWELVAAGVLQPPLLRGTAGGKANRQNAGSAHSWEFNDDA